MSARAFSLTPEAISDASNAQLIQRLGEIAAAQMSAYLASRDTRELRREHARIWQEIGLRRRERRLRMSPAAIRGKAWQAQLKVMNSHAARR